MAPYANLLQMNPFRRFLVAVLVLALPVQGAMASSRWLCAAVSAASSGAAVAHGPHADHVHPMGTVHGASPHVSHAVEGGHTHLAVPHPDAAPAAHDTSCNLCAACSVTAASPPAPIVLAIVDPASAHFPPLVIPVPHVIPDGLERPPRTI
jgi:hypothetical protein